MSRGVLKVEMSAERYRELEYFCLQYGEKRARARQLAEQCGSGGEMGMRVQRGTVGDPTMAAAMRRERLLKDCEDMEQAAVEAAGPAGCVMAQWLLTYVTRREKPPIDMAPCGRRYFYGMRRRFFHALDARRG